MRTTKCLTHFYCFLFFVSNFYLPYRSLYLRVVVSGSVYHTPFFRYIDSLSLNIVAKRREQIKRFAGSFIAIGVIYFVGCTCLYTMCWPLSNFRYYNSLLHTFFPQKKTMMIKLKYSVECVFVEQ